MWQQLATGTVKNTLTWDTGELCVWVFRCSTSKETPKTCFGSPRTLWVVVHGCKSVLTPLTLASYVAILKIRDKRINDELLDSPPPIHVLPTVRILYFVFFSREDGSFSLQINELAFLTCLWPPAVARSAVKRRQTLRWCYVNNYHERWGKTVNTVIKVGFTS